MPQASLFIVSFRERKKRETSTEEKIVPWQKTVVSKPKKLEKNRKMFPEGSIELDRYKGVTVDSSKFTSNGEISAEDFKRMLDEVKLEFNLET